ncbi:MULTISPECIES: hypothetical protein [unclassified Legionella]|uniref:hypothetical protein n=1 Tax=unclassified Legionella TaxID=2622702 RepID=UPI001055D75A|nr:MULTISPECIES: hypothetical protein [unclassified Legionella]MDI9819737.1 hypothetical protein [Legionella sp. PL877]
MKQGICFCILLFSGALFAHQQGCIIGNKPDRPRYVCMDGRSLCQSPNGWIWKAKRGCFMSKMPCCNYEATHYSYSSNPAYVYYSYKQCREGYPYRLGENQTH